MKCNVKEQDEFILAEERVVHEFSHFTTLSDQIVC